MDPVSVAQGTPQACQAPLQIQEEKASKEHECVVLTTFSLPDDSWHLVVKIVRSSNRRSSTSSPVDTSPSNQTSSCPET